MAALCVVFNDTDVTVLFERGAEDADTDTGAGTGDMGDDDEDALWGWRLVGWRVPGEEDLADDERIDAAWPRMANLCG